MAVRCRTPRQRFRRTERRIGRSTTRKNRRRPGRRHSSPTCITWSRRTRSSATRASLPACRGSVGQLGPSARDAPGLGPRVPRTRPTGLRCNCQSYRNNCTARLSPDMPRRPRPQVSPGAQQVQRSQLRAVSGARPGDPRAACTAAFLQSDTRARSLAVPHTLS